MVPYRYFKYTYDTMEEALEMSDAFEEIFVMHDVYVEHKVITLSNGRVMLEFKIKEDGADSES